MSHNETHHPQPRFAINPVELAIFAVVSSFFAFSAYNFMHDSQDMNLIAMTKTSANPTRPVGDERAPASTLLDKIEMNCGAGMEKDTHAARVVITGPICGDPGPDGKDLIKASAVNTTKGVSATVLTDLQPNNRFTTDVPLIVGRNSIRVEFEFRDGKTQVYDLSITRSN